MSSNYKKDDTSDIVMAIIIVWLLNIQGSAQRQ